MKHQVVETVTLLNNEQIADNLYLATFKAPLISANANPGQFVLVETSADQYLKRPFSFFDIDKVAQTVKIYYEVKGLGTFYMSKHWKVGQQIKMQGPLGSGFIISPPYHNVVVVGGGIGIAPLKVLIDQLNAQQINFQGIFGARNKNGLTILEHFIKKDYLLSTDDGSLGQPQNVVVSLQQYLQKNKVDLIITCGPEIMMEKIKALAEAEQITYQISYENHMACGTGACMGCTKNIDGVNKKICTDGPVIQRVF
ncbi:dihydroorotate dehydrogenase [Spiroplasma eriocheiris]|uniref:Dihydroorotate dehydrogenase n=1 Tax=Spiroplasma eriocheiris TaxID=315358 RepID=A0A0H3XHW8_9MOLU|nr:dihydroorotate dehydrogenase [Spiroplasma eriocheiris]AHF57548.1 dihydroorotate dehydrogenase electron transfer subunit [Spiroplasma eriocheiris CCTCC M 207170]AKM54005.1 dihydroorotate dehydrogenase [Spiroplasma eriocheiris]